MRRSLVPVVLVVALLAAACGSDAPGTAVENTSGEPTSDGSITFDTDDLTPSPFELTLETRLEEDGTITLDASLDLFASAFGSFPGGDAAAFPELDPHSATLALFAVAGHYDDLTDEQRSTLHAVFETGDKAGASALAADRRRARQPAETDFGSLVQQAREEIGRRTGRTLDIPVTIATRSGTEHWAIASPRRDGEFIGEGTPDECLVELWPERLTPGDFSRSVVTHEVFHCFQYTAYDDLARTWDTAPWITEGQAFWVAAEIVGTEQGWVTRAYAEWLCRPEISLWKRIRSSMGFYAAVDSHGPGDLWDRLDDMLGLGREQAVAAAGMPAADTLRITATSRLNDADDAFGAPWTLHGEGIPTNSCREAGRAGPDNPWEWSAEVQSFASGRPVVVTVSGDVLRVDAAGVAGAFEFSDGTLLTFADAFTGVICMLEGGCECPDGRTIGDSYAPPGPVAVAVGGRAETVSASLLPFSLEDACVELDDVPRMTLRGNPTIELAGGACVSDGRYLDLVIGYRSELDARLQPEPWPQMYVYILVRAVPGTWDTGSIYISPNGVNSAWRDGDHSLVITMREDLLAGTFSWSNGSGSYSCPRFLTPEELVAWSRSGE